MRKIDDGTIKSILSAKDGHHPKTTYPVEHELLESVLTELLELRKERDQLQNMLGAIVSFIGLPVEYDTDLNTLLEQARAMALKE